MNDDAISENHLLQTLQHHLTALGDANDAEDHGYAADAQRIRQAAFEGIHSLLQQDKFVSELFPNLEGDLSTQFLSDVGWVNYRNAISARLQVISSEDGMRPSSAACGICSQIKDFEVAMQKYGWPENDTSLPAAAASLVQIRQLVPFDSRTLDLWRCPQCGAYYLYKTDYEYLVNGTEDEQSLTRLTPEQAAFYLEE